MKVCETAVLWKWIQVCLDVFCLPVRIVFTSSAQRLHSVLPRFLISRMDAVIATSVKSAEFVPNVYAVVPHGIDLARFHPSPDRERSWARLGYGGRRGLAVVGRLYPSKGTDQVVDTLIEALPRHPDVTALIIGKTTVFYARYVDRLKKRVARAGLSERILFTGEIPAERMPGIYRGISVLLALPRHEPYGLTPLEAMASKTPFIATPTGNFLEFSDGNKAGLVVPEGRIYLAVQHLDSLLGDSIILEAYAKAAHGRVARLYSIEGEAPGIAPVYERLWMSQADFAWPPIGPVHAARWLLRRPLLQRVLAWSLPFLDACPTKGLTGFCHLRYV